MKLHAESVWGIVADYLQGNIGFLSATWMLRTDRAGLEDLCREYAERHPKDDRREPGEEG